MTSTGVPLLDGISLAKELATQGNIEYCEDSLDDVYAAVRAKLESRLDPILEKLFRHVRPSNEYETLAQYAWRRIYTLNIDDGIERAFRNSSQNICVRISSDSVEERDAFFQRLDVVKLNGSIDRLSAGIVFSSAEYAQATNRPLPWYEQCASDFLRMPFLFVGTKLNEPLLKYHIERYKKVNGKTAGRSYVITPSATPIQAASLLEFNIVHIPGTLSDFTDWLKNSFPKGLSGLDLATSSLPQYARLLAATDPHAYTARLDGVSLVSPDIASHLKADGAIRRFYKGFQPTWKDIVDGVPAELDILTAGRTYVLDNFCPNRVVPFVGPAGSGKSTLLMQICYSLCRSERTAVYFVHEPLNDVAGTLEELDRSSSEADRVIVAIDNVDLVCDSLAEALQSNRLRKTAVICAGRESSWNKRTKQALSALSCGPLFVNEFSEGDAEKILGKLEHFGSWTVLGQMKPRERIHALVNRARKQLLIALLESTFGRGFEDIIASDYNALSSDEEKMFFLTVGVISERHFDAPVSLVDRALSALGILSRSTALSEALAGIVFLNGDRLIARHPVYVRHLLDHVVDPQLTARAINGLLKAFSHYKSPVMKHLNKVEAAIYKGLINHRFLWQVLNGREELILSLYRDLEKSFELDGLFWLQYGLALRDVHNDDEALEKLRTAFNAYPMPHTQHALGQQLLILGSRASEKVVALAYVEEARGLLEPLDDIIDSSDTYPLVTLAEGHTKIVRRVEGDAQARGVAKSYIAALDERCRAQQDNIRLRECHDRIFRFAATGTYVD